MQNQYIYPLGHLLFFFLLISASSYGITLQMLVFAVILLLFILCTPHASGSFVLICLIRKSSSSFRFFIFVWRGLVYQLIAVIQFAGSKIRAVNPNRSIEFYMFTNIKSSNHYSSRIRYQSCDLTKVASAQSTIVPLLTNHNMKFQ